MAYFPKDSRDIGIDAGLIDWMRAIRREIHEHPELSFQEKRTSQFICEKLDELNIPYTNNIGGTGVLAYLGDREKTRGCVVLRADMDALPITENTGLPFSSKNPGVMHACGHDGHVAMLLGAASILKRRSIPGKVILLFQPAEEKGGGAERMLESDVLAEMDTIFAGHIDRHLDTGQIAAQPGLICAFTDEFSITIGGKGGHAAKPHETTDCIVVASLLVMSLQTLVSRETNPVFPSVVTVGKLSGGSAPNVIADRAMLEGTIRTTDPVGREKILNGLKRMVCAMEDLYEATASVQITPGYPPVINHETSAGIAMAAARQTVGDEGLIQLPHPSLGGEDFSFYLNRVPGCMVRFGAKNSDLQTAAAHSPGFDFDEGVLPVGAEFLARVALLALADINVKAQRHD